MTTSAETAVSETKKKPVLALAIATALGVGYIPKAPGTFGSLAGILVAILTHPLTLFAVVNMIFLGGASGLGFEVPTLRFLLLVPPLIALIVIGLIGVWSATRAAEYAGVSDPQYVVIDEVSGMHLTLVLAIMPLGLPTKLLPADQASVFALYSAFSLLNWKYLLAGFILFRVFDIWKPFPIRRLEKWPGGWGIMADDWLAGVYAAIVLRIALHFGFLTHF